MASQFGIVSSGEPPGGDPIMLQPTSRTTSRKVSINSDKGMDNPGFEHNPRRKISANSDHSEIGPVRKKSILINATTTQQQQQQQHIPHNSHQHINIPQQHDNVSLHSVSFAERTNGSHKLPVINVEPPTDDKEEGKGWLYTCCLRCNVSYDTPSWEPKCWKFFCPYPYCPSYRQFARLFSIILIGVLLWVPLFVIVGPTAAPGGQLFSLVTLTVAANFGGWLMSLTTLPRLIGMLFTGILMQNLGYVNIDDIQPVTAQLRKLALTIILIRAGLEMDPEAFKKIYKTVLKLAIIPWAIEGGVVAVMSKYILGLSWIWAFLLGAIFAAVSPAVVVACLYRLRVKGYGMAKGIPTLIIAVSGIDDALSVAVFGIISSILFSEGGGLAYQISQAPVCIFGGLGFGVLWGFLLRVIPEKDDDYVVPIRTLLLFGGGLVAVYGSEELHYEGAGPLAVVFAAFTSSYFWCKQGWELEENPVSTAFEIFWMIFEPILFGLTGATVKIAELDGLVVRDGFICLISAVVIRIICTILVSFGDQLNWKERVFVSLSWMSKATVQAALGPVALRHITQKIEREGLDKYEDELRWADIILVVCILSIVVTAPLGAILISMTGTKLLQKTKQPVVMDGWRRSHRPSLHDISIIDEEEERDEEDLESPEDIATRENTASNKNLSPGYTISK